MYTKNLIPVLAAAGRVAAQAGICTTTTTVNSAAEATGLGSSCQTVKGDVVIGNGATGQIDMGGLQQVTGDFKTTNATGIISLSASDLSSVGGDFRLEINTLLSSISFPQLSSVGGIYLITLPALSQLSFGKTISKAKTIFIGDTFLSSLGGLDVSEPENININNNKYLADLTLNLDNLSQNLSISANGANTSVNLPNAIWINSIDIRDVSAFSAPQLQIVNQSARFDNNEFSTFSAPNLTSTKNGDVAFVNNTQVSNITFPQLTSIGGALQIANNSNLDKINGFPKVKTVGGAIKLRGVFDDIEFPALNSVKGTFDASSTQDIKSSCDTLSKLSGTGTGNPIQGSFHCQSNNATANNDTSTTTSGGSGGNGGSGGSGTNNTAAGVQLNYALAGVAVVAGFATLW